MERKSFLDQEAPVGYVAGLGRGASGFTTQADLGSSRRLLAGSFEPEQDGADDDLDEEGRFLDAADDDDEGVGSLVPLGDDDDEADRIYEQVEARIQAKKMRGKKRPAEQELEEGKDGEIRASDITIGQSIRTIGEDFKEYKEQLSEVSLEEWANLPESGDFTRRNKRTRKELQEQQRFYRNSDSAASGLGELNSVAGSSSEIDVVGISIAKDKVLAGQLISNNANHLAALSSVDRQDYLGQLGLEDSTECTENKVVSHVGDYHKTRVLFTKMRESNPHKPDAWIASARLEFENKKFNKARDLIQEGCEKCPKSEKIWLVNIEMNESDLQTCRIIVAEAVRYNPKSLELWLKAVSLENDTLSKKRILKKALVFLPKSTVLWLEVVKYEDDKAVSVKMLAKATELIPKSVDLWLKLVELESLENARKTLNLARTKVEKDQVHVIWIAAAKLEESATQNELKVNKLVSKCFESSASNLDRYQWLHEAVVCESEKNVLTARAIVFHCMEVGMNEIEDSLKLETWQNDAQNALDNGSCEVARSIYLFATANYPHDTETWLSFISMERQLKNHEQLYIAYEMAIKENSDFERFYLMYAKDKWTIDGAIERSRDIISEGLEANPDSEDLWFAAIKLEWKSGSKTRAHDLFETCRAQLGDKSSRVWYKNVTMERQLGNLEEALNIIDEALAFHPDEPKLYLQMGQIYESKQDWQQACESYNMGTKACAKSPILWIHLAHVFSTHLNKIIRARSTLDQALSINPTSDAIYAAKIELEQKAGNLNQAKLLLAHALKVLPHSAVLWAQNIKFAKQAQRKNLYTRALNSTDDDPLIILTIAVDLWFSGKISKAQQFFRACMEKDPGFGDYYIYHYAFLKKHGSPSEVTDLETKLVENDPHRGDEWCRVLKRVENIDREPLELLKECADTVGQK